MRAAGPDCDVLAAGGVPGSRTGAAARRGGAVGCGHGALASSGTRAGTDATLEIHPWSAV
ncbi:hypothetical protein SAZ11_62450 [Streptomyces sp. FXJ1.4098]|nr:hypothetical protein [Streptomyces sp. FXJ1.4098]